MARFTRYVQKVFGASAGTNQMAEFGSLAAGSPQLYNGSTITPTIVQTLANYATGWFGAILGANSPALQDMNSLFYLITYQLAYLMQAGIPEWETNTVYYKGDFAADGSGSLYVSLQDSNSGHALTNAEYWEKFVSGGLNPQVTKTLATKISTGWTNRSMPNTNNWNGMCYSKELSLYVAVSSSAGTNAVATSPDGKTWTARTSINNAWEAVAWSPQLNLFCAVSLATAASGQVMTSPDGTTWTSRTGIASREWLDVRWVPELSLFVAVGETNPSSVSAVMTSPDGVTWTDQTISASVGPLVSVSWSPELALLVAVSSSTFLSYVVTSPDGVTWTIQTAPSSAFGWGLVTWNKDKGQFMVADGVGRTMLSYDGITWVLATQVAMTNVKGLVWVSELGLWLMAGTVSTIACVAYSSDGSTWVIYNSGIAGGPKPIVWAAKQGYITLSCDDGSGKAFTSLYCHQFIY